jgi:hypothetical protein
MGLLGLFGADTEGGGILGGLGRTIRDAAPVMSAYGRGEDMGLAQMRSAALQGRREERLQQEMLKKQAAAMAERMGLDPALASSPETVFSIYKAQKAAEIERKNRAGPQPLAIERALDAAGVKDPAARQKYILESLGGGRKRTLADEIAEREEAAPRLGLTKDHPAYPSFVGTGRFPREDQAPLTATDKKAILEADEGVLSAQSAIEGLAKAKELSAKAYDGPTASARAFVTGNMGYQDGKDTMELEQVVTQNALAQMKTIFGANPTEGERKILLDIQGSVNKPKSVRDSIYDRANELIKKRLEFNQRRAAEMRGGTFYGQGGRAVPPASPAAPGTPSPRLRFNPQTGDFE